MKSKLTILVFNVKLQYINELSVHVIMITDYWHEGGPTCQSQEMALALTTPWTNVPPYIFSLSRYRL